MDDKKVTEDKKATEEVIDRNEWEEPGTDPDMETDPGAAGEDTGETNREQPAGRALTRAAGGDGFSDWKEYPQDPFSYFASAQVDVTLSSGNVQYETTDFVLPGRDGFDVRIARRYDSGCANLVDLYPDQVWGEIRSAVTDNKHYTRAYGLGYGWSFVLPSIEAVPYLGSHPVTTTYYDYVLHMEDGRTLRMDRTEDTDEFYDYTFKDVIIQTSMNDSTYLEHTYPGKEPVKKRYDIIIEYKNGHKDYFARKYVPGGSEFDTRYTRVRGTAYDFKLIARQDKFGNTIFFELEDYGKMKITDTWGREIKLGKSGNNLTWTLPDGKGITYHVETWKDETTKSDITKLAKVTNQLGLATIYQYKNAAESKGQKSYGSEAGIKDCYYLLLKTITYPGGASTQFEYGTAHNIKTANGGLLRYFPLQKRKDVVGQAEYNLAEYSYQNAEDGDYIEYATVTTHQEIKEVHKFIKEGWLVSKEVKDKDKLISKSEHNYWTRMKISRIDYTYGRDQSKELKVSTFWKYSDDKKLNITQEKTEYSQDSGYDQVVDIEYTDPSMIKQITRKKDGNTSIKEKNTYSENRLTERLVYEVVTSNETTTETLKEKTTYEYGDTNNPNCVTKEKQYCQAGSGPLGSLNEGIETVYTYNAGMCTHQFVSKTRNGMKDADGTTRNPLKESFTYNIWGRMTSKTDAGGQVTNFNYDALGRIVKEIQPSVDGMVFETTTVYRDQENYITVMDAGKQKTRIGYTPLGNVSQVCLAVSDAPAAGDVVLQSCKYNQRGELETVIAYDGNGTAAGNVRKTEQYTYDSFGRILSRGIAETGYYEAYQYDEVYMEAASEGGKLYYFEQKTVGGDSSAPDVVTQVYRDQGGNIRKEFLSGDRMAVYDYDKAGNQLKQTDAMGKIQENEYDYAGRLIKSTRTDAGQKRSLLVIYDALGRERFRSDEAGYQTEFRYDAAGRLIETIAPFSGSLKQETRYYYDPAGNLVHEKRKQSNGWQETRNVYDARNRLKEVYQYLSAADWIRTSYQYDVLDRMIRMRTGDTPAGDGVQITRYIYNRFGKVLTMIDARNCQEIYGYDKTGRLLKKTDRNGNRIMYQYNALDSLIKEAVSPGSADGTPVSEREYAYSRNGRRIREISRETAEGGSSQTLETRYRYDKKGQLIRQDDPGNAVKHYTYDRMGNRLTFQLTRNGQSSPDIDLAYSYDDLYRLKQVRKGGTGGVVLAEYEYDVRGNRKTLKYPQAGIETSYTYNDSSRVLTLESKRQGTIIDSWSYGYDIDGNLVRKTSWAA